jgi:prephenate dehydrogenase
MSHGPDRGSPMATSQTPHEGSQVNISIIGVGLIGGSIGMAARQKLSASVCGYDPDALVLGKALELGALERAAADIQSAVATAQVVFVAAPVGALKGTVSEVLRHAPGDCVVSDVGSTKRMLAGLNADQRFVGGHPLAGAETAGVEHSREDLFDGATWYLTPAKSTSGVLYERLQRVLVGLGAQPAAIDPADHDRLMACVSHLPHIFANLLVAAAVAALQAEGSVSGTGPSFRDATRVAGANSAIWTDIYLSNSDALIDTIEQTMRQLDQLRTALRDSDSDQITAWNDQACADREALMGASLLGGAVHELRVSVPNRPGVIAEIALALGRAGVNIVDMALSPSADNSQGVVSLWLRGDGQRSRAGELIAALGFPVTHP